MARGKVGRYDDGGLLEMLAGGRPYGEIDEARRLGAKWSRALLGRHIQVGLAGDDETARKCREFALEACCFGRGRR